MANDPAQAGRADRAALSIGTPECPTTLLARSGWSANPIGRVASSAVPLRCVAGGRTTNLRLPTPTATLRILLNSFPPFGSLLLQSEACRLVQARYRARRRPMSRLRGSLGTCAFGGKLPETSGPGRLAPSPSASACLTWFERPEARALLQADKPRTFVCDDPSREIRSSALPTPALPFFPLLFALPADLNPLCPAHSGRRAQSSSRSAGPSPSVSP
jgi:hypothetical protein